MDGLLQARACAPSSLICSTSTDASLWRAFAMMYMPPRPPPHACSSDPSVCCTSRQYCSSGRSTHAEAGMPAMVSVVDAIYFKNHSHKAWPSLSRGISSRSNDGLPKATCPRSSHCSARKSQFPSEGTTRTTTWRLFLAPSLADRRFAGSPSGLWPTRNTARLRGGLQRSSSRAAFFANP